ncbi:stalk domain-containing protein [Armatimonas sp.]|uniref:stalk domain-containing protein n=1 Tax=Armatimonas sp. TaxID=1872638 RepID=UPI003752F005
MIATPTAIVQIINVTVDGDVVQFMGQPPIEQGGMVLVPLRGVFEKLGAQVFYEGATKTIRAVKGATEVSLRLGSTEAKVNGQSRTLALPAQTQQGTTLVPLRFVSEALGAQVSWRGASKTVVILTTGGPPSPMPVVAQVEVQSLTHDSTKPLHGGDKLSVTLLGTPGSVGTFSISGVESARDLPLRETSTGTYMGSFTVPNGTQVKNAPLFAILKKATQSSPMIQSSGPVTLDGIGPQLGTLSPLPDSTAASAKLLIYGTLSDVGTGIDSTSVQVLVNGTDVTAKATVTEAFFSYKPDPALPAGKTTVAVVARDMAGNETHRAWSFQISAAVKVNTPDPALVAVVAPQKPTILTPIANTSVGNKVEITGKATPGATVRYRLIFEGVLLILPTDGIVTEGEVKTDAKGVWKVPAIALTTPLGVSKLSYTLTVATVGAGDTVSEVASVTFKK